MALHAGHVSAIELLLSMLLLTHITASVSQDILDLLALHARKVSINLFMAAAHVVFALLGKPLRVRELLLLVLACRHRAQSVGMVLLVGVILAPPEKPPQESERQAQGIVIAEQGNNLMSMAAGVHLALSGGIRAPSPLLVALTALVARLRLRQGQRAALVVIPQFQLARSEVTGVE